MQTWTETLLRRGLPSPFVVDLIDTRVSRAHHAIRPRLNFGELKRFCRIVWRVYRALRSGRYAILHMNCSFTLTAAPRNLLTAWLGRRAGVPCIVHLHGTFTVPAGADYVARQYRRLYRRLFERASWILALGQPSYEAICALGAFGEKTTRLMPNFVDFDRVPRQTARMVGRDDSRMKVVFTGTLVASKGIYVVAAVAQRVTGMSFVLVGDGPSDVRAAFIRHLEGRGLGDSVVVSDPQPNDRVLALLADADAFFFPSAREGFPFSVLEAMAVGLPIVASNVGALPEMVDVPAGGFLMPPDDVAGFADALERLRSDPKLRYDMGRHNRTQAEVRYDYDVVVKRLCGVYREALGQRA